MIKVWYRLNLIMTFIWSFVINTAYWIKHIHQLSDARKKKVELIENIKTIRDVGRVMTQFVWRRDPYYDWTPWVITIVNEKYADDCDGASVLGKFLLKNIGMKSRILHLRKKGSRIGHAVCLSCDNKVLVTNNHVIIFNEETRDINDWRFNVLDTFKFRYDVIL